MKSFLTITPRPPTEPRDGPTRNFHEKYRKNAPPWNPKKTTPKIPKKTTRNWFFFSRYFGFWGLNSGSPEFRAGGSFFSVFFVEIPGQQLGRGVLNLTSHTPLDTEGVEVHPPSPSSCELVDPGVADPIAPESDNENGECWRGVV